MKPVFFKIFFSSPLAKVFIFAGIIIPNLLISSIAQAKPNQNNPSLSSLTVSANYQLPIEVNQGNAVAINREFGNQAPEKKNDIGLAVQFGSGTNIGIQGKFGVSDNISLRPEFFFVSDNKLESNGATVQRLPLTSSLTSPVTVGNTFSTITPFTTNVPVPINVAGNLLNGNPVPINTVLPSGTNIGIGSTIASGQVLPAGLTFPPGTNIPVVIPSGTTLANLSGTSFGLAATYDFKLDSQGKSVAYLGPKVSLASTSGSTVNTFAGASIPIANINISETKIGLVAGVDYGISDSISIGANATYNFSQSVSGSASINGVRGDISNFLRPSGSALDFGVRASYRF